MEEGRLSPPPPPDRGSFGAPGRRGIIMQLHKPQKVGNAECANKSKIKFLNSYRMQSRLPLSVIDS